MFVVVFSLNFICVAIFNSFKLLQVVLYQFFIDFYCSVCFFVVLIYFVFVV